jgi:chemotaxis signal transduction protein
MFLCLIIFMKQNFDSKFVFKSGFEEEIRSKYKKLFSFRINETWFVCDSSFIVGSDMSNKYSRLPFNKDYVLGIMSVRSEPLTVISICDFLNLEPLDLSEDVLSAVIISFGLFDLGVGVSEIGEILEINVSTEIVAKKIEGCDNNLINYSLFVENNEYYMVDFELLKSLISKLDKN